MRIAGSKSHYICHLHIQKWKEEDNQSLQIYNHPGYDQLHFEDRQVKTFYKNTVI